MDFLKKAMKLAFTDLANQYAVPVKSLTGSIVSRKSAKATNHITKACIDHLNVCRNSMILELGYGRGLGLKICADKMGPTGTGMIFGIERSQYMEEYVRKKYVLEIEEEEKIKLDTATDLRNLPYPTDFFDGIFHVDFFYFLHDDHMFDICRELNRVLKPGGKIITAMQLERLRKLEKYGILDKSQYDPIRYLSRLECARFLNVKMEYIEKEDTIPYQLLSARKLERGEESSDPEDEMRELEKQIKKDILIENIMHKGYKPTAEDMQIIKEF